MSGGTNRVAGFLEDRERNVIPRWRDFRSTVVLGELDSSRAAPEPSNRDSDLSAAVADWTEHRTASFAGDLISAALVAQNFQAAREASEFVVSLGPGASPQLRAVAMRILVGQAPMAAEAVRPLDIEMDPMFRRSAEISETRRRLSDHPSDAVLWMDLAFMYAVRGLSQKAERAVRIALNLAPMNRFILRSAARFFIHIDRPDIALDVIRKSLNYKLDPWLAAAEIAVALAAKRSPWSTRDAHRLLSEGKFAPRHLSELSSAMGTLEFNSGESRKAKKLFRRSLVEPNDNSLAQARWIWRRIWGSPMDLRVDEFKIDRPFEAATIEALGLSDWNRALDSSQQWLADQPFSGEAARFATYLASTVHEKFTLSEAIANFGLVTHPGDSGFQITLAFCYASTGRRREALDQLSRIRNSGVEDWVEAAIEANYGLLAFRNGDVVGGRGHYATAVTLADQLDDKRTKVAALVYWANEEIALSGSNSVRLLAEARAAAKHATGFFNSFLVDRVAERLSRHVGRGKLAAAEP
jgi:tetratricopeptide (TPR) repeat protein